MLRAFAGFVLVALFAGGVTTPVSADDLFDAFQMVGGEASAGELEIWGLAERRRYVKTREEAERYLAKHPESFVAELALGHAHHYGEANFPKALFHLARALQLFEARFGSEPSPEQPWRWHARILLSLSRVHGDLEDYERQLAVMNLFNARYTPRLIAEQAWPLMKLRRFPEARRVAEEGVATGDLVQMERGLNALCAIEFEAGDDEKGYEACQQAVAHATRHFGSATAVDLGNFAEAARSVFRFDEAEQLLMRATRAPPSWYGNPWLDLADLYMRGGRFAEALSALKQVPVHRAVRPAYVRDSDRNEARRSVAAFLLLMGRPDEALAITEKAVVLPDRRAHNSRDPEQDRAIVALVDRQARLMTAQMLVERAAAEPFYSRWWARAQAQWQRFQAWLSARQASRYLNDDQRLVGTFAVGTARSAVVPPWLLGDLVTVLGPGVVRAALDQASANDSRSGASAYYDAIRAEAALAQGDEDEAMRLARSALEQLQPGDALARERARAILGRALPNNAQTAAVYEEVLGVDPGLFRRLGWALPVRVESSDAELDEMIADALLRSPRFQDADEGLRIQVQGGRACLFGLAGASWGCSETQAKDESGRDYAQRVVDSFHRVVFSPRINLSRIDINSLDGSNRTARDPLQLLMQP